MEQRLQLKLKGNTSANLYFSGIQFQSVFVGGENVQAFVRIYVREPAKVFIQFLLIIVIICLENAVSVSYTLLFNFLNVSDFTDIPREFE